MSDSGFRSYLEILGSRRQLSRSCQTRFVFTSVIAVAPHTGLACLLALIHFELLETRESALLIFVSAEPYVVTFT